MNLKAFTNFVREQHELWEIALKLLKALHTAPEKIEQKYKGRVIEVKRSFSRSLRPNFGFHLVLTNLTVLDFAVV